MKCSFCQNTGHNKRSCLFSAILNRQIPKIRRVLKQQLELRFGTSVTPLLYAVQRGHEDIMKLLLKEGANPIPFSKSKQWNKFPNKSMIFSTNKFILF